MVAPKTDKKKHKDRYSTNSFAETQWHKEVELIIKFNESVFEHEILSF